VDGVEEYLVLFKNLIIHNCNCPEAEFLNVQLRLRLMFLGNILRVLILEVSVYNVYNTEAEFLT